MIKFIRDYKEFISGEGLVCLDQALLPRYAELDAKYDFPNIKTMEAVDQYYKERRIILGKTAVDVMKQNAAWFARKEKLFWSLALKAYSVLLITIIITAGISIYAYRQ